MSLTHRCFPLVILVFLTAISASATGESSIRADYQPNNAGKGGRANWLPANKTGFGTSYSTASNVWFTLQDGRLSEVYYPRLDTPSVRNLDFVVTDGQSFAVRVQDASTSLTRLAKPDYRRRKELHAWFKAEEVADSSDLPNCQHRHGQALAPHHNLCHGSFPANAAHRRRVCVFRWPTLSTLRYLPAAAQQSAD